ncbi:MAG: maleylacetoacetate isomerase [Leptothrix sp. (in: b-proteobacteria)]
MQLYTFFYSSAAYRVRIALALKGLAYESIGVNLRAGAQRSSDFLAQNPAGLVPTLVDGELSLSQSLAIIDHLDRVQPAPLLLPLETAARARVLEIALLIACDIHPLDNLRVLKYLTGPLGMSEAQKNTWYAHWIIEGFTALEAMLPDHDGWCVGSAPTLADCCLVPQVANAERMKVDLSAFPRVRRINAFARQHPAFVQAEPQRQPDYIA